LEFEDGLERALRNLGLVRRVAGEKLPALDERVDNDGPIVPIRTRAEKARVPGRILLRLGAEEGNDLALRLLPRYSAGITENKSSMEPAPISASMAWRSASDLGR
jgi:hypothetical protein